MKKEPWYEGPDVKGHTDWSTTPPADLEKIVFTGGHRLAKLGMETAGVAGQDPIPFPRGPWWIGGEDTWQQWTMVLRQGNYVVPGAEGKPVWTWSKGLLGKMVRAAQFLGWAGFVGDRENCYQAFCLACFAWPENEIPTRQAFEKYSGSDRDRAVPLLRELWKVAGPAAPSAERFDTQELQHFAR